MPALEHHAPSAVDDVILTDLQSIEHVGHVCTANLDIALQLITSPKRACLGCVPLRTYPGISGALITTTPHLASSFALLLGARDNLELEAAGLQG